jgi:hypothetical protein
LHINIYVYLCRRNLNDSKMKSLKITLITISVLFASLMTDLIMFNQLDQLHLIAGIIFISMPLFLAFSLLITFKK